MEKRWYVFRTHVGCERKVPACTVQVLQRPEHGNTLGSVLSPTEKVIEIVQRSEAATTAASPKFSLKAAERIKVIDGPFRDFTGVVKTI